MVTPTISQALQIVPQEIQGIFQVPDVFNQFNAILKTGTNGYIQSALIAIAEKPDLMACTHASLIRACLRSASIGLSLDPLARQAFLIPRNIKIKAKPASSGKPATPERWEMQACFQPHYHGLYDLAVRTNKYRYISVNPIYPGERVFENPQNGMHYYTPKESSLMLMADKGKDGLNTNYRDVTSGKETAYPIGYLAYFKTTKGFEKTVWMTIKEIHAHAMLYAPENYKSAYGAWKDDKKRPTMEMKTVFIALTKFMDLSGKESETLRQAVEFDSENETDEEPINITPITIQSVTKTDPQSIAGEENQAGEMEITEEDNQLIYPLAQWCVFHAMNALELDQQKAISAIVDEKLGSKISKGDFKQVIAKRKAQNSQSAVVIEEVAPTPVDDDQKINPLDIKWVEWASRQWGLGKVKTRMQIDERKDVFKEGMTLIEFKRVVNGR